MTTRMIDISHFLQPPSALQNEITTDTRHFMGYEPYIPKLFDLSTANELIEAKRFIKNCYGWTDDNFLTMFVKASCMNKRDLNLPTKKDLEKQLRKFNKQKKRGKLRSAAKRRVAEGLIYPF